ncbi:Flp pilus assembly protein CpaB [Metapseudomonas lalkuanensis]|uniref:Flp pilus assembly protein CpaB n=1 Tax=Metapseudomonas lalkuanensis TaxID=2604832 RepID=A0A5J6QRP2_9GAMM|nr:Flp pilus assembly protein CpaB [Pseudomonas lalkuanensis]QEY64031.1 Flp pilus assembly protein CpaB [Pseudomonas lalkuanensis]UCO96645.1 Flp pilus assembly protein CpaB [Pseudomonas lalkuanensis]
MSARTLTLVALSLLLGLGAAWMANNWLSAKLNASPDDNLQAVVVATVEIPFGQMIEAQQVTVVRMPKGTVPDDAFNAPEAVVGKIATFPMLRGDILRSARVAEHLGGSTLASLIESDKRAISVRVDDVVGVGGFLLPGNRVDVLATRQVNGSNDSESKTILQDLRVLAVDQTASTDKTQPVVVRAVTLEMTPKEAEVLVKAMSEGRLQLALRNPLDDRKKTEAVAATKPAPAAPAVSVTPRPVVRRMEGPSGVIIIRGTEVKVAKAQF